MIQEALKDLVPAVLGIGLGKHHQFNIGWRLPQGPVVLNQIADFILGQCKSHLLVGPQQNLLLVHPQDPDAQGALPGCWQTARSACLRLNVTDSVMRSCKRVATSLCSLSSRVSFRANWYRMPRSIRVTFSRRQLRAISVALEDQGDTVPCRGITRTWKSPSISGHAGAYESNAFRWSFSARLSAWSRINEMIESCRKLLNFFRGLLQAFPETPGLELRERVAAFDDLHVINTSLIQGI